MPNKYRAKLSYWIFFSHFHIYKGYRPPKYWVFFSFSSKDTKDTKDTLRLQREFEQKEVPHEFRSTHGETPRIYCANLIEFPRHLIKTIDEFGRIPKRLKPTFTFLGELGANAHLGRALKRNLERSSSLVVMCSPNAAKSKGVQREIEYFKELGKGDRIFCVLLRGRDKEIHPILRTCGALPSTGMTQSERGDQSDPPNFKYPTYLDLRKTNGKKDRRDVIKKLMSSILRLEHSIFTRAHSEEERREEAERCKKEARKKARPLWAAVIALFLIFMVGFSWLAIEKFQTPENRPSVTIRTMSQ